MTIVPQTSDLLRAATETLGLQPYPPLRGVTKLTNKSYTPEKLEKGILRQRHNLTCFKDGTIRYDAVNAPLTHFKPSQFHLDIKTLQTLGYLTDRFGEPLESEEQIVELKPQDIILPQDSVDHFKRLSAFLDDLLSRFFKAETFYDFQNPQDLVGALLVGVSPKASVGTVGRIIGFTNARVCYAYPTWHTAKYRGCDGDVDSLTLLLDVFLNYSPTLCPDQVTGLLDTPMLIEPLLPPSIVVKRPSQFDLADSYTREFYMKTEGRPPARSLEGTACIHQDANSGLESTYRYTHWSSTLVTSEPGSSYSYPAPMPDKVSKQIVTASKILAVDVDGLICSLLNNYLVKEILDNLDSYSTQKFRCKGCGETYRRPPVKGACLTCGRELMPSVALSIAEKYILLANELIKTHQVAQPIMDKIRLALDNLQLLSESKKQTSIADFI
jgi:DNA polymerase II large subunit